MKTMTEADYARVAETIERFVEDQIAKGVVSREKVESERAKRKAVRAEMTRVRSLILRFLTNWTKRPHIDGRLTEDQKDDVQDAFLAYLTKIRGKRKKVEVYLHNAVGGIVTLRKRASRITVGDQVVPRESIKIRNG